MKEKEIINNLTEGEPTRAVQLPDGRWVTEKLARQMKRQYKLTPLLVGGEIRFTFQSRKHWWNRWHYLMDGQYPRLLSKEEIRDFILPLISAK